MFNIRFTYECNALVLTVVHNDIQQELVFDLDRDCFVNNESKSVLIGTYENKEVILYGCCVNYPSGPGVQLTVSTPDGVVAEFGVHLDKFRKTIEKERQ